MVTKMMFRHADIFKPGKPWELAFELACLGAKVWCDGSIVEADCDSDVLHDVIKSFNRDNCGMKYIGHYYRGEVRRPSRIPGTECHIEFG
jgi:hypothetical protein